MKGVHAVFGLVLVCAVVLVSGIGGRPGWPRRRSRRRRWARRSPIRRLTDDGSPAEGPYDFQFKAVRRLHRRQSAGTVRPATWQ